MGVFGTPSEVKPRLPRISRQACIFSDRRFSKVRSKIAAACATMSLNQMLELGTASDELLDSMAFRRLVQRLGISGVSAKEYGVMFEALDKRGSGTIDSRETVRTLYGACEDERRVREKEKSRREIQKSKRLMEDSISLLASVSTMRKKELLLEINEKNKKAAFIKLQQAARRWQPGQPLVGLREGGPLCVDELKQIFRALFSVHLDNFEAAALLEHMCSDSNDDNTDDSRTVSTVSSTLKSHDVTVFAQRFVRLAQELRRDEERQHRLRTSSFSTGGKKIVETLSYSNKDDLLNTIKFNDDDITRVLDKLARSARAQLDGSLAPDLRILKNGAKLDIHALRRLVITCFRVHLSAAETAALMSILPISRQRVDAADLLACFHKLVRAERAKERHNLEKSTYRRHRRRKRIEKKQLDLLAQQSQRAIIFSSPEDHTNSFDKEEEQSRDLHPSNDVAHFLNSVDRDWHSAERRRKRRVKKRTKALLREILEEDEDLASPSLVRRADDEDDDPATTSSS